MNGANHHQYKVRYISNDSLVNLTQTISALPCGDQRLHSVCELYKLSGDFMPCVEQIFAQMVNESMPNRRGESLAFTKSTLAEFGSVVSRVIGGISGSSTTLVEVRNVLASVISLADCEVYYLTREDSPRMTFLWSETFVLIHPSARVALVLCLWATSKLRFGKHDTDASNEMSSTSSMHRDSESDEKTSNSNTSEFSADMRMSGASSDSSTFA